jgi:hypothetical protein
MSARARKDGVSLLEGNIKGDGRLLVGKKENAQIRSQLRHHQQ